MFDRCPTTVRSPFGHCLIVRSLSSCCQVSVCSLSGRRLVLFIIVRSLCPIAASLVRLLSGLFPVVVVQLLTSRCLTAVRLLSGRSIDRSLSDCRRVTVWSLSNRCLVFVRLLFSRCVVIVRSLSSRHPIVVQSPFSCIVVVRSLSSRCPVLSFHYPIAVLLLSGQCLIVLFVAISDILLLFGGCPGAIYSILLLPIARSLLSRCSVALWFLSDCCPVCPIIYPAAV